MKSEIIKQEKNPFLKREEFILKISSEAAPTESEVKQEVGKDEALTVVKKINTNFGQSTFITEVVVYDSIEDKKAIEVIPKKIRKKMEAEEKARIQEEKKKAEEEAKKKAEEEASAAAEKPEEESTEETKEEEKVE
jgi:ribosomal protein S24E